MKTHIISLVILSFLCFFRVQSQVVWPTEALENLNVKALSLQGLSPIEVKQNEEPSYIRLQLFFETYNKVTALDIPELFSGSTKSTDTLFVGEVPNDSVYITGNFFNDGPIFVVGEGILIFENADALINGDVFVWGDHAVLQINNSTMHFPQLYIYQRTMASLAGAHINISNTTLDYSGLSHNLIINDSSSVQWFNVQKMGFTTCGMSQNARIDVNGTPQAGEFIMMDSVELSFQHAKTILLWHHLSSTASLDYSFPQGDTILAYDFNAQSIGVTNINYSCSLDSCTDVMWGLMPEPGSIATISNSTLRTIGLWFKNQPAYNVAGLVNNTQYANFTAPLTDHNVQLINTYVQTWSLYMFHGAQGFVNNCIVGEIGTMGNSSAEINNSIVDGSGGYLFCNDTSLCIAGFSHLNSDFHTDGHGIGIMAYSSQNMSRTIAKGKSILMVLQSNLPQLPEYYDNAMVWYLKMEDSNFLYTESVNAIKGSAWIEKASTYYTTEMAWYKLDYRMNELDPWTPIGDTAFAEVYSDTLTLWQTNGLLPGMYLVRLTMCDNTIDSNKVEVVRQYVMQPNISVGISFPVENSFKVFPNPVVQSAILSFNNSANEVNIRIFNSMGQVVKTFEKFSGETFYFNRGGLKPGVYFIECTGKEGYAFTSKILIQ